MTATPLDRLAAASRTVPAADLSLVRVRSRLSLRAADREALASIGRALSFDLPMRPSTFERAGTAMAIKLGPDEWLLTDGEADTDSLSARLTEAVGEAPFSLVDVSDRSVTIAISGAMAATVLNAGCPLDLGDAAFPVGAATRTVFAKAEIVLARTAETEFHIDVWRSFAPYVWTYLDEARRELAP